MDDLYSVSGEVAMFGGSFHRDGFYLILLNYLLFFKAGKGVTGRQKAVVLVTGIRTTFTLYSIKQKLVYLHPGEPRAFQLGPLPKR